MSETTNKIALVTGAGSGIGYELAKCFAEDGCHLVLVGRSEDELQDIASDFRVHYGIRVEVIAKDLYEPNAARDLYTEVREKGIKVDYLVHDAAQGVYGYFAETDLDKELATIQLDVCSLVVLTKLFLNDMIIHNQGRILHVASAVSRTPVPYSAVYGGTKAFVVGFAEAMVAELEGTNVTMTALQPIKEGDVVVPDRVARDGYEAMLRGNDSAVSGFPARPSMREHELVESKKRLA
jgi:short-subunit dehydrogenase